MRQEAAKLIGGLDAPIEPSAAGQARADAITILITPGGPIECVAPVSGGALHLTILADEAHTPPKAFRRRAIKKHLDGRPPTDLCWLVGELNGVRLYIDDNRLIMTTQDLNP